MDDATLAERLRDELRARAGAVEAPAGLRARAEGRARRIRRVRVAGVAAAVVVVVALGAATLAASGGSDEGVRAGPGRPGATTTTTTTSAPAVAPGPSQDPEAAARDGVVPELAALPLDQRLGRLLEDGTGLDRWAVARPPEPTGGDCVLGDRSGVAGVDWICTVEYGEVLVLGSGIPILRAYPMPALPPTWLHVTDAVVYAGRVGDGGLPTSSLVRIDKATGEVEVILVPSPSPSPEEMDRVLRPGWRWATAAEAAAYPDLVTTGPDATGTPVRSSIGPTAVDLPAIEALFA